MNKGMKAGERFSLRETYSQIALSQIPRILSLQDRNRFSPSYGCFHRSYWLHRTSDFPMSIAQMGSHILALVWKHELRDNRYYQKPKILEWCIAGVKYWMKIQKKDGSFDEWYPNERGWAGPTGYLVHAMADTWFILGDSFPEELRNDFLKSINKAAHYLVDYDEQHILANHHAIALLPIYEAYVITKDERLLHGFERRFSEFLKYCFEEGWSLEYDGPDIGYLSGTVSFLSRLHKYWPDTRLKSVIEKSVLFSSYFLYPNGYYGGAMGSRETSHFYHFGYEYWAGSNKTAEKMAEVALGFLQNGGLVSAGTQEDHYVLYRIPEFIEAYLCWQPRSDPLVELPFEGRDFVKYFEHAGIYIRKFDNRLLLVNLKKGGVIKLFDLESRKILHHDNGWIGKLADGKIITSQWNGDFKISVEDSNLVVKGRGNYMVTKLFSPLKMILFRIFMITFGNSAFLAYKIKSLIRKILMVGCREGPVSFSRKISEKNGAISVSDEISLHENAKFQSMQIGGEFQVRYVPQSRYFQNYETEIGEYILPAGILTSLNKKGKMVLEKTIN